MKPVLARTLKTGSFKRCVLKICNVIDIGMTNDVSSSCAVVMDLTDIPTFLCTVSNWAQVMAVRILELRLCRQKLQSSGISMTPISDRPRCCPIYAIYHLKFSCFTMEDDSQFCSDVLLYCMIALIYQCKGEGTV